MSMLSVINFLNYFKRPKQDPGNIGISYHRKQALEARVIKACVSCGEPGVKNGQPVGSVCPWCNSPRPDDDNKGIIWQRTY